MIAAVVIASQSAWMRRIAYGRIEIDEGVESFGVTNPVIDGGTDLLPSSVIEPRTFKWKHCSANYLDAALMGSLNNLGIGTYQVSYTDLRGVLVHAARASISDIVNARIYQIDQRPIDLEDRRFHVGLGASRIGGPSFVVRIAVKGVDRYFFSGPP
jgi:hypothetical protein